MSSNLEIIFAKRPLESVILNETFTTRTSPAPTPSSLSADQLLVEVLYISLDPIMRLWLNDFPYMPLSPGDRMRGFAIVRILHSNSPAHAVGTVGISEIGWTQYAVIDASAFDTFPVPEGMPLPEMLGMVGFTGLTGYFGMIRNGKVKEGDVVVVSTAAGATGSAAAQVAKIQGAAKVVGLTGSDDKCAYLRDHLKLDVALNYKDPDFKKKFEEAVEGGINVYFDNVGGETLELALDNMAHRGHVAVCGQLSGYNSASPAGVRNTYRIFERALTIEGVNIFEHLKDSEMARADLSKWYKEGKLRSSTTVLEGGLEAAPSALLDLFSGKNTGKCVLRVKAE